MPIQKILTPFALFALLLLAGVQPAAALQATATPEPMRTATPLEDGSIFHEVQPGETLWNIAMAYGVQVDDLTRYNQVGEDQVVYSGQKLVIAPSYTPTTAPTITDTPLPPTRTPRPTYTPRPPTATRALAQEQPATLTPTITAVPPVVFAPGTRRILGISMIVICSIGIVVVIVNALRRR